MVTIATPSGWISGIHDVFISFSSRDQGIAERIYDRLARRGVQPWMSSRDIPPGADYQGCIVDAMGASKVVLLVFSSHANASSEILKELALAGQKLVIPARVEDVAPQGAFLYQFSKRQFFDLFQDFDRRLEQLCDWVKRVVDSHGVSDVEGHVPDATVVASPPLASAIGSADQVAALASAQAGTGDVAWWKWAQAALAVLGLAIGVSRCMQQRPVESATATTTEAAQAASAVAPVAFGEGVIPERGADTAAPSAAPAATETTPPPADAATGSEDVPPKDIRERDPAGG